MEVKFGFERLLTIFFTLAACCCPGFFCPRPPGDLCDCDNRQFMDSHLVLIQRLLEHQPTRKHRKISPFLVPQECVSKIRTDINVILVCRFEPSSPKKYLPVHPAHCPVLIRCEKLAAFVCLSPLSTSH